ncbi:cytidylyltransferase domain-containing protein [Polaromonas sp. UC242_47]|uniref:acylneuraminate cytidylyltransferase family protein n=1 Tax=Polaromonas sp. UC242_47 TaxID=3374626 RepID=UPI0037879E25
MNTFALIPARGGSKGIPRKNIKLIAGKPLIVWTIEAALRSSLLSAVVVSTDDPEIADVARRAGAQVPFMRPSELALDQTPGLDPVLHALDQLPQYDSVLLLQPTSPLRTTEDIDACLRLAMQQHARSAVSVSEADTHPYWTYRLTKDQALSRFVDAEPIARRQDLPQAFALNGALYFADANWLRSSGTLVGPETLAYVMAKERSVDVDTPLDWKMAELLLKDSL